MSLSIGEVKFRCGCSTGITVKFRWWAMPLLLGSLKVLELLRFAGIISDDQGLQAARALGRWTADHGVKAE